jgi:6-phosphogluconolactonase/glucosamine-6-phosphate isomerase/deaminase
MAEIHALSDESSAKKATVIAIEQTLRDAGGKPIMFLVSGGTAFDVLNELSEELFDSNVTVSVVDERFTTDPEVNNFLQLQKTDFYHTATSRGVSCIDTIPQAGETIEALAKRFDDGLKTWRTSHPDGIILVFMGIGRDGHTAGIMAYPDDIRTFQFMFEDADVWVTSYNAGNRNPYPLRVTTTLPFLRSVDTAIVYVVGEAKKNAVLAVCAPEGSLHKTPGRIIHEMKHCLLYTDQSVATVKI